MFLWTRDYISLSNVPQVLEPFRNGAYRDDDGYVVGAKKDICFVGITV